MTDYHPKARKRRTELARDAASQFDETLLSNTVLETVQGHRDDHDDLIRALDVAERAYDLAAERDHDDQQFDAAETVNATVGELVDEAIARACADVLCDGHAWTDAWKPEKIADAQREAIAWIDAHRDATERADALELVERAAAGVRAQSGVEG